MGSIINKIVFMPQLKVHDQDSENDIFLPTSHGSQIQVKTIIKNEKYLYLIISHVNAEDVYGVHDWALKSLCHYVNVNIIMYEYTGYGTNNQETFTCSEQYCYNDIDAVYKYLTEQLNVPPNRIVAYGRSVGSGPSCYLAEKQKIRGLIINCGFLSVFRVIFKFRFTLPGDLFPNIDRMRNIECPVCVFHSIKDEIIPFYHGKELYKASKNKFQPLFIDGTSHNNIDRLSDDVYQHMQKFFKFLDSEYQEVKNEDEDINEDV